MPLIRTHELTPESRLSALDQLQTYNALDCCLTFEVHEALQRLFNEEPEIYSFERALQAPVLEVSLRGFRIDPQARAQALALVTANLTRLRFVLHSFAVAVWGKGLNPASFPQMRDFFYGAMKLPEIWVSDKGQKKLSFKREVLEKLEIYFHAMPIINCIMQIRENKKLQETLETEIDSDGRWRTSYNIAGTNEDRFSSNYSSEGTGGNSQNLTELLRNIFVADPGWKLAVIDLEQADSREVGWLCWRLFNDPTYLDACESGDLHTLTARLTWPELPWSGDAKKDRKIADEPFYRTFSRRDMCKRLGHATNFLGLAFTLARILRIEQKLVDEFQERYLFKSFPCITRLQRWTAAEIQTTHQLTTSFGRRRHFFGRPDDVATVRQGLAFLAASPTAVRTNLGFYRIWEYFGKSVQLLAQTHDSVTFQYREKDEAEIIPQALRLMKVELEHGGRVMSIPGECKIGWNWRDPNKLPPDIRPNDPLGLNKYKKAG